MPIIPTCRRIVVPVALAVGLLAGCGQGAGDRKSSGSASPTMPSQSLPLPISSGLHLEVVPMGDSGEFVVVDGGAERAEQVGTDIWLVSEDGARQLGRFDRPTLASTGWQMSDGSVQVLGLDCEDPELCGQVPLVRYRVDRDGADREAVDLKTNASAGFRAEAAGDDLAVLIFELVGLAERPALRARMHLLAADGESTDLGAVGDGRPLLCSTGAGVFLYPRNEPSGPEGAVRPDPVVREVRDGRMTIVGRVPDVAEQPAGAGACGPNGEGEVQAVDDWAAMRVIVVRDGEVLIEDIPSYGPPPDGVPSIVERVGGHYLRWVELNSEHRAILRKLQVWLDGRWVDRGETSSTEGPVHTVISGDVVVTDTYRGAAGQLELVEPT